MAPATLREGVMSPSLASLTLVIGGARSGKSRFAETLCAATGLELVYVATATVLDDEMRERVDRHRARRENVWRTVEAPLDLAGALGPEARPGRAVLVDCLTLWLTNVMLGGRDVDADTETLLDALSRVPCPVVLVSNEVGWGIVPENALAREFRDRQGLLNQRVATISDRVTLMSAGLPLDLKLPKEPPA